VRLDKARELYAASMVDRAGGNLVSARMNLKLAVAFDPENATYQEAFAQLGQAQLSHASLASNDAAPTQRPAAQKAYDEGCAAEAAGDVDRAVRLFEAALRLGEDPLILNRLGVVLAMRRNDVRRGQQLLERAVALAPMNPVYTHNLSKVLGLAAARVVDRGASTAGTPKGKGGFWKRLLGR
jgi:Flp pilus assembly protein TadD